jgi:hypothetical protein
MVNWPAVCRPRDQGGLGILNYKRINIAMMVKWIWRLLAEQDTDTLWYRLLKAKYAGADDIFSSSLTRDHNSGIVCTKSRTFSNLAHTLA